MENDSRAAMSAGLLTTAGMCEIELAIARALARARVSEWRVSRRACGSRDGILDRTSALGRLTMSCEGCEGCEHARDGVK